MSIERWPYTNLHDLNLDWVLEKLKEFSTKLENFAVYYPHISDKNEGKWNSNYNYTPNEIVLYENALYIALKSVPVGISLNNEEYWMKIADVNVDVLQLENEIANVNDRVTGLEASIEEITATLSVTDVIIAIGDSWGVGRTNYPNTTNAANGWPSLLQSALGISNNAFKTYAHTGSGFGRASSGVTFTTLITQAVNDTSFDNSNVKIIIVGGGINDRAADNTSIEAGVDSFCTIINNNFPNAKTYFFPMMWPGHTPVNARAIETKSVIINRLQMNYIKGSICENTSRWMYGIEAYWEGSSVSADHTSLAGMQLCARRMLEFIANGKCVIYRYIPASDITSPYGDFTTANTYGILNDNIVEFHGILTLTSVPTGFNQEVIRFDPPNSIFSSSITGFGGKAVASSNGTEKFLFLSPKSTGYRCSSPRNFTIGDVWYIDILSDYGF